MRPNKIWAAHPRGVQMRRPNCIRCAATAKSLHPVSAVGSEGAATTTEGGLNDVDLADGNGDRPDLNSGVRNAGGMRGRQQAWSGCDIRSANACQKQPLPPVIEKVSSKA